MSYKCWASIFLRMAIGWHFLYEGLWKLMQKGDWTCAGYLQGAEGPLAGLFKWMAAQSWIVAVGDYAVMFGLVAMGLALISGVLARVAALFGVALLGMFYCAQPPEPFAVAMSAADGHFFLVERNVLEIAGLLAVAVFPVWKGFVKTLVPGGAVLAVFGAVFALQVKSGAFQKVEAVTSATVKVHEFTALAALKAPLAETAKIGGVEVSRLALGGDLMAGHAHARDLIWPDEFMRRYNQGGTLERTIRFAVQCGVNAIFAEPEQLPTVLKAAADVGKDMAYFASCADRPDLLAAKAGGAKGVYLRPETADLLAKKGDAVGFKELFAALKATGLAVGIGAEEPATVAFAVQNGCVPDYWVVSFHSHDYPAAELGPGHNNLWCRDPEKTRACLKARPEPWVAIRGLAGGGITTKNALTFAYEKGVDVVSLNLLDFQVVDTVNEAVSVFGKGGAK